MTFTKTMDGTTLTIAVEGRLDTNSSPVIESALKESLDGAQKLIFDFAKLEYVSSAGLRVLLFALKAMNAKNGMVIRNVCDEINEVFEITGFSDILTVE